MTIVRDKTTGTGHVYGDTRSGTMFGAGYIGRALAAKSLLVLGLLACGALNRRRIVPAESIEQIDDGSKVIGLRVERDSIPRFL